MLSSVVARVAASALVWVQFSSTASMPFGSIRSETTKRGSEPPSLPSGVRASERITEPFGCMYLSGRLLVGASARLRLNRSRHASGM